MSVAATGQLRERREVDLGFVGVAEIRAKLRDALWPARVPADCKRACVPAINPTDNTALIGCNQIGDRNGFDHIFLHWLPTFYNWAVRIAASASLGSCCSGMLGFVEMGWVFVLVAPAFTPRGVRCLALDARTGSNPMVGLRGSFNDRQNLEWVKANGAGKDDQFDDVDPALATFNPRNEGLVASELRRQVLLSEARLDAGLDEGLTEGNLSRASDCSRHAPHTFCDVASGGNLLSKK
jgi:hypothetical protein